MRLLLLWIIVLSPWVRAEHGSLEGRAKAQLAFELEHDPGARYPHFLKVFLHIENRYLGDLRWVANRVQGIEVELLGPDGKPVHQDPSAASIQSGLVPLCLPYGSRLDWLISHGGVSMAGETQGKCALVVGGRGWLLPIDSLGSYSLGVRLRGAMGEAASGTAKPELLLEIASEKILIGK